MTAACVDARRGEHGSHRRHLRALHLRILQLGYACNNACTFCAQGDLRAREPVRDDALVRADLEASLAATSTDRSVAFVGGEPTLREDLAGWIVEARRLGASDVLVQTNGRRLAYASYAQSLAAAGLARVEIALQGATAAMHDHHTGVEGSFAQTVAGIGNARAAGIAVAVSTVATRSSYRHLAEVLRVAHARGALAWRCCRLAPAGRAAAALPRLDPPAELLRPYLAAAALAGRQLGIEVVAGDAAAPHAPWFAGLGAVEPAVTTPQHRALPLLVHVTSLPDRPLGVAP